MASRTWVYTLVNTDYDGAKLLPHFLNYYHNFGITWRRFMVLLHHTPGLYSRKGLEEAMAICAGYAVECRVWEGQYSHEEHLVHQLSMFNDHVADPTDWIVAADVDELQDWGGKFIKDGIWDIAEYRFPQATYVRGRLIDRVAADGSLQAVQQPMGDTEARVQTLFKQYPLTCDVTNKLYKGWDTKVIAFRAYLRPSRGYQHIIEANDAAAYFGPCDPPPAKCARPRGINLDLDLYNQTPYHRMEDKYMRDKYDPAAPWDKEMPPEVRPWITMEADTLVDVHHFKWHAGLLTNMKDRMDWYSGDCKLGENEDGCTPRLAHWRNSAKTYEAMKDGQPIDVKGMDCIKPEKDVEANTTFAGAAWEWMEDWLNVKEGSSGNTVPKQYRSGQFKQDSES